MPKNIRPYGWFDTGDPAYKGTTVAERRQMQNTWDLLEQQEIANKLKEQELELEKQKLIQKEESDERLAQAILDNKTKELQEAIELQYMKQEHDLYMRNLSLCDKLNISYDLLSKFKQYLNQSDYDNELKLLHNEIRDKESYLKTLHRNAPKDDNIELWSKERELQDKENNVNKLSFNIFHPIKTLLYNRRINELKREIHELKRETTKEYKQRRAEYNEQIQKINKFIKDKNQKIQELIKLQSQQIYTKYMDFIEFRKNNYNKELETLFTQIELGVYIIDEKDIKKQGTIKDYMNYITKVLNKK